MNKLLREFTRKKSQEQKASSIEVEVTELDVLLEEVLQLKKESELIAKEVSDTKSKQAEEEFKAADSVHRKSLETWSVTKKRERESEDSDLETTPYSSKRKRNNGTETIEYLREQNEKELQLREAEIDLKK